MSTTSPTVGGYSFYLNVVVVSGGGGGGRSLSSSLSQEEEESATASPAPAAATDEQNHSDHDDHAAADNQEEPSLENGVQESNENGGGGDGGAVVSVGPVQDDCSDIKTKLLADPKMKLLMEGRHLVDSVFNIKRTPAKPKSGGGENFMTNLGNSITKSSTNLSHSISKSSSNLSRRASQFVANKTMVLRAQKAVVECIPAVTAEIGIEMVSISKRFQQGPVFVLEVDMKGCDLLDLLSQVLGEEAGQHYRNVKTGLDALGLPKTQENFLSEILPVVRKGMMDKMSEIVPEKMKLKKAYSDLEIQCVALEDAEEAKWLYNFLAFMEEMK